MATQPTAEEVSDKSASQSAIDALLAETQPDMVDLRSLGVSGLNQYGGFVYEEILPQLKGREAARIYKEMRLNDPACGTILWFIKAMARQVGWYVKAASQDTQDEDNSEFIDSCLHDMDQPLDNYIDEHLSMIEQGFAPAEILLKRRLGQAPEPWLRSKFTDGRIGLRGLPLRSQETIVKWEFDDTGAVTAMYQQAPPRNQVVRIPIDKLAPFRTTNYKGNPEGESALRRCFRPYFMKVRLQNIEAIGVERDLAGFPVFRMPYRMMTNAASPEEKKQYLKWQKMITRMKRGEQEGAIIPSQRDANNNEMYELKLLSSGGARAHNISEIINRYDDEIFRSLMSDFMKLGSSTNSSGSWAMHGDKTQMWLQSISVYLEQIRQVYNLVIIPKLIRMNGLPATDYPTLEHTPLEKVDAKQTAETLLLLSQSGMYLWPNEELQQRVFDLLGVSAPVDPDRQTRIRETMPVATKDPTRQSLEVPHDANPAFQPDMEKLTGDEQKDREATGVGLRQVRPG